MNVYGSTIETPLRDENYLIMNISVSILILDNNSSVGVSFMASHRDDGGLRGKKSTVDGADGVLDIKRLQAHSLARIADRCFALVNGVLLTSSELDVDGELVNYSSRRWNRTTLTAHLIPLRTERGCSSSYTNTDTSIA